MVSISISQERLNSNGGRKMVFLRRFYYKANEKLETICLEFTIVKKKWCIIFVYHPLNIDKKKYFDEISVSLNKILGKYHNIILAGDLNTEELRSCSDSSKSHLFDMKDIFSLPNLIKKPTCFKSQNSTLLDLILTNRPRSFLKSQNFETGLSDCHKLICSILRASFKRLPPKIIKYGDQKYFNQNKFLHYLDSKLLQEDLYRNC